MSNGHGLVYKSIENRPPRATPGRPRRRRAARVYGPVRVSLRSVGTNEPAGPLVKHRTRVSLSLPLLILPSHFEPARNMFSSLATAVFPFRGNCRFSVIYHARPCPHPCVVPPRPIFSPAFRCGAPRSSVRRLCEAERGCDPQERIKEELLGSVARGVAFWGVKNERTFSRNESYVLYLDTLRRSGYFQPLSDDGRGLGVEWNW